jgi:hypothetical protein
MTIARMSGVSMTARGSMSAMTTGVTVSSVAAAKSSKRHGRETGYSKYQ